jgi:hypothetical protein
LSVAAVTLVTKRTERSTDRETLGNPLGNEPVNLSKGKRQSSALTITPSLPTDLHYQVGAVIEPKLKLFL